LTVFGEIFLPRWRQTTSSKTSRRSSAWSSAGEHGVDRARPDLVPALDQLGELVDDRARLDDVRVVALDRQPVAAQRQRDPQPLAEGVEHAVADGCELGGDVVGDRENFLHSGLSVGAAEARTAGRAVAVSARNRHRHARSCR
jgi:hypothetical protein